MKIERTKNTLRSVVFGVGLKLINIILPFVSRTVILYFLGEKYLGLGSLFSSVLSFFSLAEMGIGAAMVFSMYKPIAEDDDETVCAILNFYKKTYRVIGTVILVLGIAFMPFLKLIIKDEVPADINVYWLYLIYLANAVVSYFLFAYINSVLQGHQRNDVESKIGMVITPVSYIVMLSLLAITGNYYAYIIWSPIFTIITNIIRWCYVKKHYPTLTAKGEISVELKKSIGKKVKALIGTKLNTVVLHAADNIVMSTFFGLTVIAMYGNYYYIMSSITGFLGIIYSAMLGGLGNSLQTESVDKNYNDFKRFSFMNSWIVGWCAVCLVCLYQPFMRIWVGEDLMFPFFVALQFALYFYIYQIRKIPVVYKDAAGIWWEDRFRPYVCMVVNLVLNIILSKTIGISGIILSTVFSWAISIPWEIYTIFKYVFKRSSKEYYTKMFLYAFLMIVAGAVTFFVCSFFGTGILALLGRMVVCLVVPNVLFALFNYRRSEFKETISFVKRILKRQY